MIKNLFLNVYSYTKQAVSSNMSYMSGQGARGVPVLKSLDDFDYGFQLSVKNKAPFSREFKRVT